MAVTEKSDRFRACGTGFHCSSLMGSSFVSPYGAFSFSLPFQPFPSTCCGGARGLWLIISERPCPFVLLARAPLVGCSIHPGGKGEGLTILGEQEHVASSPLWHGLSLALNHKGRKDHPLLRVGSLLPSEPSPCSSHPQESSPGSQANC